MFSISVTLFSNLLVIEKKIFLFDDLSYIQQLLLASFNLLFNGNACNIGFCCNFLDAIAGIILLMHLPAW